jgi:hypothetical protein
MTNLKDYITRHVLYAVTPHRRYIMHRWNNPDHDVMHDVVMNSSESSNHHCQVPDRQHKIVNLLVFSPCQPDIDGRIVS